MNKREAQKLADAVSPDDVRQMFLTAQKTIEDWTTPSRVNKGASRGAVFNILKVAVA